MKLSDLTPGRENNFNLIRITAALAVLITHSFAVAIGTGDAEPIRKTIGMSIGSIAVDVFFITSGFLVTASLLTRQSTIEFIWARALRIFPALLMMLLLTVFGMGGFFTTLPLQTYLTDSQTYIYLVKCSTLITGVAGYLPGVFNDNPYKSVVNGSLWTLPIEIKMYAILTIGWVALRITKRFGLRAFEVFVVTCAVVSGVFVVAYHFHRATENSSSTLFFMFFSGAAFYVLKEHIRLSRWCFWTFVFALMLSATVIQHEFFVVYVLTISYVLFYIAYVPSGLIRKYNLAGDYSYGVYIYAFPVQQSVAALIPGVSVLSMLLISVSTTLVLAALSWHLLERRALGLKELYVGHTRRILKYRFKGASTRSR